MRALLFSTLSCLLLTGLTHCSLFSSSEDFPPLEDKTSQKLSPEDEITSTILDPKKPLPESFVPEHLRGSGDVRSSSVSSSGIEAEMAKAKSEGIIITDPDNPHKFIPELDKALRIKKAVDWETNYVEGRTLAMREQRPLLIWFTDSNRSPACKKLNEEFFATPEFSDWAEENIIRLKLDLSRKVKDKSETIQLEKSTQRLAEKYQAKGKPTLIILTADGQVVEKIKGYVAGESKEMKDKLLAALIQATKQYKETKAHLMTQGYRDWKARKENKNLFAKLVRYEPSGKMTLQEANGALLPAHIRYFSPADKKWIQEQQAQRL